MIERVERRFALKPDRLAGDVAYGTGEMLGWLVGRDIDPHIPVWDKSKREDGTVSRADFTYDQKRKSPPHNNWRIHLSKGSRQGRRIPGSTSYHLQPHGALRRPR